MLTGRVQNGLKNADVINERPLADLEIVRSVSGNLYVALCQRPTSSGPLEKKEYLNGLFNNLNHLLHFSLTQSIILYQLLWATPPPYQRASARCQNFVDPPVPPKWLTS